MGMLSVVIPSYNEERVIPLAAEKIDNVLQSAGICHEILFVDDGSTDSTWENVEKVSSRPHIRGIRFSRNFGKEAAIAAGLSFAKGDCCVVIDCDLQHPPEKIVEMYRLWEKGYEIVEGVKSDRGNQEGVLHRFAARGFNSIISKVTGFNFSNASDFKLLDRKAVDVLVSMQEKNAFFRALSSWVGFKVAKVDFEVQDRIQGESKWSTKTLTRYAIHNVTSFSTAPMQIVTFLGILMLAVSVLLGGWALVQKISGVALRGFTTVIILQLFSSSIIMISIGIVGYYIARIFEEVKNRPLYIVSSTCGEEGK